MSTIIKFRINNIFEVLDIDLKFSTIYPHQFCLTCLEPAAVALTDVAAKEDVGPEEKTEDNTADLLDTGEVVASLELSSMLRKFEPLFVTKVFCKSIEGSVDEVCVVDLVIFAASLSFTEVSRD